MTAPKFKFQMGPQNVIAILNLKSSYFTIGLVFSAALFIASSARTEVVQSDKISQSPSPKKSAELTPSEAANGAIQSPIKACDEYKFVPEKALAKNAQFWCASSNIKSCSPSAIVLPNTGVLDSTALTLSNGTQLADTLAKTLSAVADQSVQTVRTHIEKLERKRVELEKCDKTFKLPLAKSGKHTPAQIACADAMQALVSRPPKSEIEGYEPLSDSVIKDYRTRIAILSQGRRDLAQAGALSPYLVPKKFAKLSREEQGKVYQDFQLFLAQARKVSAATKAEQANTAQDSNAKKIQPDTERQERRPNPLRESARRMKLARAVNPDQIKDPDEFGRWLEQHISDETADPAIGQLYSQHLEKTFDDMSNLQARNPLITKLNSANPSAAELSAAVQSLLSDALRPTLEQLEKDQKEALKVMRASRSLKTASQVPDDVLELAKNSPVISSLLADMNADQKKSACQALVTASLHMQSRELRAAGRDLTLLVGGPLALGRLAALGLARAGFAATSAASIGTYSSIALSIGGGVAITDQEMTQAKQTVRKTEAGIQDYKDGADANSGLAFEPLMRALDLGGAGTLAKAAGSGALVAGSWALTKIAYGAAQKAPSGTALRTASENLAAKAKVLADTSQSSRQAQSSAKAEAKAAFNTLTETAEAALIPSNADEAYVKSLENLAASGHLGNPNQPDLTLASSTKQAALGISDRETVAELAATVEQVMTKVDPKLTGDPSRDALAKAVLPRLAATILRAGQKASVSTLRGLITSKEMTEDALKGLNHFLNTAQVTDRNQGESVRDWFTRVWTESGGNKDNAAKAFPCAFPAAGAVAEFTEDPGHPARPGFQIASHQPQRCQFNDSL